MTPSPITPGGDSLAAVAEWLRAHGDNSTADRIERLDADEPWRMWCEKLRAAIGDRTEWLFLTAKVRADDDGCKFENVKLAPILCEAVATLRIRAEWGPVIAIDAENAISKVPTGEYPLYLHHSTSPDCDDRLEHLDAEMRKEVEIRLFDGQWVNIVNAPGQTIEGAVKATEAKMRENITRGWPPLRPEYKELRAENEQLRAKLAACESALLHYVKDEWAPVADYSDNYWYQRGKAPWKHAENALASRAAAEGKVGS